MVNRISNSWRHGIRDSQGLPSVKSASTVFVADHRPPNALLTDSRRAWTGRQDRPQETGTNHDEQLASNAIINGNICKIARVARNPPLVILLALSLEPGQQRHVTYLPFRAL